MNRETGFLDRAATVGGQIRRYQVYLPREYDTSHAWPVILFLHGSGERGADNQRQVAVGLGPQVRRQSDTFPAIVVFPQVPENGEWNQVVDVTFAQLDAATREFGGDPDRTFRCNLASENVRELARGNRPVNGQSDHEGRRYCAVASTKASATCLTRSHVPPRMGCRGRTSPSRHRRWERQIRSRGKSVLLLKGMLIAVPYYV